MITPSKKASVRLTETAAAAALSRTASRGKAIGSSALANVAKRQIQKSQATAAEGHTRSSGQRRQAKRDVR